MKGQLQKNWGGIEITYSGRSVLTIPICLISALLICVSCALSAPFTTAKSPADPSWSDFGYNAGFKNPISFITVNRVVESGCKGPKIIITIKAPRPEEVKNEIVIALDTSGSFGKGGNSDYGIVLMEVMPEVLKFIYETFPRGKCNISFISWDNNIDFVYSPIISNAQVNNNTKKAKLIPIEEAIQDISEKGVFNLKKLNLLEQLLGNKAEPNKFIIFGDDESTDYNVGILGALDVLKANKELGAERRFILLITGKSEFVPLNDTTKLELIKSNYKVYPVGLGIPSDSKMAGNLKNITNITKSSYTYSPGIRRWTTHSICKAVTDAVEKMNESEIASNISIIETLYPYLNVNRSSITLKENGTKIDYPCMYINITKNNSTTLKILLNKTLNMSKELEITIDTEINMSLPIEVSSSRRDVPYYCDPGENISSISYYWQDRNEFIVNLTERFVI